MDPVMTLSSAADPGARKIISDGLNAFNDAQVGYADRVPLHVLIRDPTSGDIVGGIIGSTSLGLLFIDLVYLPEALRGRDVGTRMLALAEEEAQRRGCRAGVSIPSTFKRLVFTNALVGASLVQSPVTHRGPAAFS